MDTKILGFTAQLLLGCRYGGAGYFWYYLAAKSIGFNIVFMLFQIQHAPPIPNLFFDVSPEEYKLDSAGVFGSTICYIPPWLQWLTCNVQYVPTSVARFIVDCFDHFQSGGDQS
jgi:hypothetical protein